MDKKQRSNLAGGIVLVLIGAWFLLTQLVPGLEIRIFGDSGWPLIIISVGVILLIIGLLTGVPEMAVPACIVGGIGGLLYWQNATGNWESWAYAWALIPGFVGVGTMLSGIIGGKRGEIAGGAWMVFISLILFAVFSSFLGGLNVFGPYWPVLLIALGLIVLAQGLFRKRK
jgi:hypothetical protein